MLQQYCNITLVYVVAKVLTPPLFIQICKLKFIIELQNSALTSNLFYLKVILDEGNTGESKKVALPGFLETGTNIGQCRPKLF